MQTTLEKPAVCSFRSANTKLVAVASLALLKESNRLAGRGVQEVQGVPGAGAAQREKIFNLGA